jgi:hypothetical protein
MGFAYVRHCSPLGIFGHAIGLEFRTSLMSEELGQWQIEQIAA